MIEIKQFEKITSELKNLLEVKNTFSDADIEITDLVVHIKDGEGVSSPLAIPPEVIETMSELLTTGIDTFINSKSAELQELLGTVATPPPVKKKRAPRKSAKVKDVPSTPEEANVMEAIPTKSFAVAELSPKASLFVLNGLPGSGKSKFIECYKEVSEFSVVELADMDLSTESVNRIIEYLSTGTSVFLTNYSASRFKKLNEAYPGEIHTVLIGGIASEGVDSIAELNKINDGTPIEYAFNVINKGVGNTNLIAEVAKLHQEVVTPKVEEEPPVEEKVKEVTTDVSGIEV